MKNFLVLVILFLLVITGLFIPILTALLGLIKWTIIFLGLFMAFIILLLF